MVEFQMVHVEPSFLVCVKPPRVRSTDEPGGVPELCREALGNAKADVRTVHRLDQVVSGLMVLARGKKAASELSRQIREDTFGKEYLAVIHGRPEAGTGTLRDLLLRDKAERKTYVVAQPGKDVQEAVLDYRVLSSTGEHSLVQIRLRTGRTHQIRCQFSSRGFPLVGDRKYSTLDDGCEIALWSRWISFQHPVSGERVEFSGKMPGEFPWTLFSDLEIQPME